jgi:hypothetical protein
MNTRRLITAVGIAGGGMLVAAFAQLGTAPIAGADVTALINELDGTFTIGSTAMTNAADAFADGNVPLGLDYEFGAADTYLLSVVGDLVYGGYESLENVPGPYEAIGFPYVADPLPTTLALATSEATTDLSGVSTDLSDAATALSSGDFTDGAFDVFYAVGGLAEAPETELIGLADLLTGSL